MYREELIKWWLESGYLDGIKGLIPNDSQLVKLYQSNKKQLIRKKQIRWKKMK